MIYLVDYKEYQSFEQAAGDREEWLLVRRLFDESIINVNSHTIFNLSKGHSQLMYTAISRKVVGKSARDNPERYCGWFWVHCFSKKFERMAREAMDICLWVLKESNKSWFDNYSVRNSCIEHIPYYLSGLSRAHFSDNLSRNSCMRIRYHFVADLKITNKIRDSYCF